MTFDPYRPILLSEAFLSKSELSPTPYICERSEPLRNGYDAELDLHKNALASALEKLQALGVA